MKWVLTGLQAVKTFFTATFDFLSKNANRSKAFSIGSSIRPQRFSWITQFLQEKSKKGFGQFSRIKFYCFYYLSTLTQRFSLYLEGEGRRLQRTKGKNQLLLSYIYYVLHEIWNCTLGTLKMIILIPTLFHLKSEYNSHFTT